MRKARKKILMFLAGALLLSLSACSAQSEDAVQGIAPSATVAGEILTENVPNTETGVEEAEGTEVNADTRVYLSWGSAECATKASLASATDLNLTFSRILTRKGARTYPYLHVGGAHCEADWEQEVPRFMDYLWRE